MTKVEGMTDPTPMGIAKLLHEIAGDNPRNIVAVWQTSEGKWLRAWWVDGKVTAAMILGQLDLARLRIYDESGAD